MARPKRFELLTPRFVVWPWPLLLLVFPAKHLITSDRGINGLHGKRKTIFSLMGVIRGGSLMRVLVCGGRNYWDGNRVWQIMDAAVERLGLTSVIQGGAQGADNLACQWARDHGVPFQTFEADWDAHGRAAGPIRNARMLEEGKPDIVIAFPGGSGTADMVKRAKKAGVRVYEVPPIRGDVT